MRTRGVNELVRLAEAVVVFVGLAVGVGCGAPSGQSSNSDTGGRAGTAGQGGQAGGAEAGSFGTSGSSGSSGNSASGGATGGSGSGGSTSASGGRGGSASGVTTDAGQDDGLRDAAAQPDLAGVDAGGSPNACAGGSAAAGDVVVDLAQTLQTMDGFGVSNAMLSTALSDAQADKFFDRDKGIGLSIFRLGINANGDSSGPWADAKKAAARGATIWAAPWTPPSNCKDNNSNVGGHLKSSCYDSWAATLAGFAAKLKQNAGAPLYALSAENEPDNNVTYDSCLFTPTEMVAFVKVLGQKLKALNPPVKLVAAESTRFEDLWGTNPNKGNYNYGVAILADSAAALAVDILATHQYETQDAVAPPTGVNKPIWQTEMSGVQGFPEAGPSSDIANGLAVAKWIHDAIAIGRVSAWHWWWWIPLNADNEGLLLKDGSETRRLYTLGNYSKFVRPGYQRVAISGTTPANVLVTAYKNPSDGTVAIVAINSSTAAAPVSFFISGNTACSLTPWVTTAKDNLVSKSPVSIANGQLSVSLAAQSVTTFVGRP